MKLSSPSLFLRKLALLLINLFFNNKFGYLIIRRVFKIKKVFVAYPANHEYSNAYSYFFYRKYIRTKPMIIGLFNQNNQKGLITSISSSENDFSERVILESILFNSKKIQTYLNAEQLSFAGILPGVFLSNRLEKDDLQKKITLSCISQAINNVLQIHNLDKNVPIIILGGNGYIGRNFRKYYSFPNLFVVDLLGDNSVEDIFNRIKNRKVILLNVSRNNALGNYLDLLSENFILINEVYPEPSEEIIKELKNKNIACYHIVGVKAKVYPPFPKAYNGGIPCCAAIFQENIEVIIKRLS